MREEFVVMMSTWDIDENASKAAFDYVTENGQKKMDYNLFSELLRQFFTNEEQGHVINMGLDQ